MNNSLRRDFRLSRAFYHTCVTKALQVRGVSRIRENLLLKLSSAIHFFNKLGLFLRLTDELFQAGTPPLACPS